MSYVSADYSLKRYLGAHIQNIDDTITSIVTGVSEETKTEDASNLLLSKKIEAKISSLDARNENIATAQTSIESYTNGLNSITTYLNELKTLANKAATGTHTEEEYSSYFTQGNSYIDNINSAVSSANNNVEANNVTLSTYYKTTQESETLNYTGNLIDGVFSKTVQEAQDEGYTSDYIISNASEFVSKITANDTGSFILAGDIDMSSLGTLSTAVFDSDFGGTLDGNGYAIKNLTISTASNNGIGLFRSINQNATVKNLEIRDSSITGRDDVGAIFGRMSGTAATNPTIENVAVINTNVTGRSNVGGLVGESDNSNTATITKSYMTGNVSNTSNNAGGLVGYAKNINISKSSMRGNVSSPSGSAGGIAGNLNSSIITDSYVTGDIFADGATGGIAGTANSFNISNSYVIGDVESDSHHAGGIVGESNYISTSYISNSYTTGDIKSNGSGDAGGIVGWFDTVNLTNTYASGTVTSDSGNFGGIVGKAIATTSINNTNHWNSTTTATGYGSWAVGPTFAATAQNNTSIGVSTASAGWSSSTWDTSGASPEIARSNLSKVVQNSINTTYVDNFNSNGGIEIELDDYSKYTLNDLGVSFDAWKNLIDLSSQENAEKSVAEIDAALEYFNNRKVGAKMQSDIVDSIYDKNSVISKNLSEDLSIIRDTGEAEKLAELTIQKAKYNSALLMISHLGEMHSSKVSKLLTNHINDDEDKENKYDYTSDDNSVLSVNTYEYKNSIFE